MTMYLARYFLTDKTLVAVGQSPHYRRIDDEIYITNVQQMPSVLKLKRIPFGLSHLSLV